MYMVNKDLTNAFDGEIKLIGDDVQQNCTLYNIRKDVQPDYNDFVIVDGSGNPKNGLNNKNIIIDSAIQHIIRYKDLVQKCSYKELKNKAFIHFNDANHSQNQRLKNTEHRFMVNPNNNGILYIIYIHNIYYIIYII